MFNPFKVLLFSLAGFTGLLLPETYVFQDTIAKAYVATHPEFASRSVVMVQAKDGHGSGFFISPTQIITNNHVIQDIDGPYERPVVQTYNGRFYRAKVIAYDGNADLALLELQEAVGTPVTLAKRNAFPGERIFTYGNGGFDFFDVRGGEASRLYKFENHLWKSYLQFVKMNVIGGFSGSPVLGQYDGLVYGVIVGGRGGTDDSIIIPLTVLEEFIRTKPKKAKDPIFHKHIEKLDKIISSRLVIPFGALHKELRPTIRKICEKYKIKAKIKYLKGHVIFEGKTEHLTILADYVFRGIQPKL